jgi:hypothetical protein
VSLQCWHNRTVRILIDCVTRLRNYDQAIRLMQRATTPPRNTKVNFYDDVSSQASGTVPFHPLKVLRFLYSRTFLYKLVFSSRSNCGPFTSTWKNRSVPSKQPRRCMTRSWSSRSPMRRPLSTMRSSSKRTSTLRRASRWVGLLACDVRDNLDNADVASCRCTSVV